MVRDTIDRYLGGATRPLSFDAVADFAALFPVEIITSMLGVPAADRQELRLWLDKGLEREPGSISPSRREAWTPWSSRARTTTG